MPAHGWSAKHSVAGAPGQRLLAHSNRYISCGFHNQYRGKTSVVIRGVGAARAGPLAACPRRGRGAPANAEKRLSPAQAVPAKRQPSTRELRPGVLPLSVGKRQRQMASDVLVCTTVDSFCRSLHEVKGRAVHPLHPVVGPRSHLAATRRSQ